MAAPTLARLVDEGDPECLAVRHCRNNSRATHAAAGGSATGADSAAEEEEDVLKLPFFLVPRPCAAAVASHLLNAAPAQQQGGPAAMPAATAAGGSVKRGKKKGKRKRGGTSARGDDGAASPSAPATLPGDEPGQGPAREGGLLRGGGHGDEAVVEAGSPWDVQAGAAGGMAEVGADVDGAAGAMFPDEVEETAGEVKLTMARLGLCAR